MALHKRIDKRFDKRLASIIVVMVLSTMLPQPGSADSAAHFSDAKIDSLLAPIALYPDTLLTQILIAATYPLDVVEAARFVAAHSELEGSEAVLAAAEYDWDPSVQALTAFPEVLERMNQDLRWTRALGEAFLQQQEAVMVSLQTLRQRARLAGTLEGSEHLRIERQGERLTFETPRQDLVYVPWYDTTSAYGEWPSQQHQPVYWAPDTYRQTHYRSSRRSHTSLLWGPAIHFDPLYYPTRLDWHRRGAIVIDRRHEQPWKHGGKDHRDRRHWEGDHRGARFEPRGWPQAPTASLSQQRAGVIDTRTASERLRALQAEAAAAHERPARLRSGLPAQRFGNRQQDPTAEQHSSTERRPGRADSTTRTSQQSAPRTRADSSPQVHPATANLPKARSPERSRPSSGAMNPARATTRTTTRSLGGSGPHSQKATPPAASQRSTPAPASTTRQVGGSSSPRRPD